MCYCRSEGGHDSRKPVLSIIEDTLLHSEVTSLHDFHREIESLGFQIKHQINWKVDTSSRGIQLEDSFQIQVLTAKTKLLGG